MTRPIRVLRVIARMNVGGPALQVTGLAEGLDPERFEHRLLVGDVGPGEADYLELRAPHVVATRVRGLGRAPKPADDLRALGALVREVRRFRPDIVHTHTAKAGALGRLAARAARTPAVVHTFHGHLLHGYFSPAKTSALVQAERVLARMSTRLVAVGAQVRDDLLAAGIGRPEQYSIVAPGVWLPHAPDRVAARADLGLPPVGPVVAMVARLTAVKRPDRFLEVAARVRAQRPDTLFVVVGEGELLDQMRRDAARLSVDVHFLGWRADVERVYAATDVVVLTSDNEGMPVSLIEAATIGRAAVTTDVGSAREVVLDGVTGSVTSIDPDALAAAVLRLLEDPAMCLQWGEAAAAHAQAAFSRERLVRDVAAIYEDLADRLDLD